MNFKNIKLCCWDCGLCVETFYNSELVILHLTDFELAAVDFFVFANLWFLSTSNLITKNILNMTRILKTLEKLFVKNENKIRLQLKFVTRQQSNN